MSPGERRVPRRPQRLGQVDAAEDRRRADRARPRRALRAAGRHACATCRRSRISPASRPRSPMSRPGSAPSDDPHQARYLLQQLGLRRRRRSPAACRAARRAGPRWRACWRRSPTSCCSTSRPTTSTCRPSNGWRRGCGAQRGALVLISHDRRFLENLSRTTVWLDRGTRGASRSASRSSRPGATSSWPRRRRRSTSSTARSCARSTGCATASPRGASATCGAWPSCRRCARPRRDVGRAAGTAAMAASEAEQSGTLVIEAKGVAKAFGDAADRRRLLASASCAATASASSGRTAAARPRSSTC